MQTVQVGGVSRSYVLHVPAAYDGSKPVPLRPRLPRSGRLGRAGAGKLRLIRTRPIRTASSWRSRRASPVRRATPGTSARAACADTWTTSRSPGRWSLQVSATACIDPKRVYAVGFSMGGGMAHYLACQAADVFAAVAPSSFDLLQENVGDCHPARPITVISFRGSATMLVPYAGGPSRRGSRHAGHVPRRAGHLPEVGRASISAPARRRRPTATAARPTRTARAASRWCCARSRRRARPGQRRHRLAGAEAASAALIRSPLPLAGEG